MKSYHEHLETVGRHLNEGAHQCNAQIVWTLPENEATLRARASVLAHEKMHHPHISPTLHVVTELHVVPDVRREPCLKF